VVGEYWRRGGYRARGLPMLHYATYIMEEVFLPPPPPFPTTKGRCQSFLSFIARRRR